MHAIKTIRGIVAKKTTDKNLSPFLYFCVITLRSRFGFGWNRNISCSVCFDNLWIILVLSSYDSYDMVLQYFTVLYYSDVNCVLDSQSACANYIIVRGIFDVDYCASMA